MEKPNSEMLANNDLIGLEGITDEWRIHITLDHHISRFAQSGRAKMGKTYTTTDRIYGLPDIEIKWKLLKNGKGLTYKARNTGVCSITDEEFAESCARDKALFDQHLQKPDKDISDYDVPF
ncbi:MAG: hypothetical protein WCP33_05205 [Deltaproteobacteria bacterium]